MEWNFRWGVLLSSSGELNMTRFFVGGIVDWDLRSLKVLIED